MKRIGATLVVIAVFTSAPVAVAKIERRGVHSWSLARPAASVLGPLPAGLVSPNNVITKPVGRVKGWVLLVHGGGWVLTGFVDDGSWFNRHGWATYSIDYRPGYLSVIDTIAAFDHLRRLVGPRATVCADGQSAGGTLVMLLAASRPALNCAISEAGIADIPAMQHQCAYADSCGGVTAAARLAFDYEGRDPGGLWEFSPLRLARYIVQPLLLAGSSHDTTVDEPAQLAEMKRARPQTITMLLDGTDAQPWNFTHASVTSAALARFQRAALALLNGTARRYTA